MCKEDTFTVCCRLQSCHELLKADTVNREAYAGCAFSKIEQNPTWVFNILSTDEVFFHFMAKLIPITVAFGRLIHVSTRRYHCIP